MRSVSERKKEIHSDARNRLRCTGVYPAALPSVRLLLCLAAALNAQTEKWETYKYPADGFRASFPSEPKLEQNRKEATLGSILMNSYCAQISNTYLLRRGDRSGSGGHRPHSGGFAGAHEAGCSRRPHTRKLNEQEIDLDGHKGVEIETENDTVHTFTRIYLVDKTLYQTMVVFPNQTPFAGANRFLDSFKLIERIRK